ncbi:hypothetical protein PoB_001877300 [Plakobranchus ocellatus]|uniref:Guanylate cyclase domain-containing protein n=1 Tax=Plakobranchus ocellatus TaxID=259542 RepID=A0AAV3ZC09_9GAST|nr:hypothetical protein PoB_001877300 [Plakobranchus ocellatus]
MHGLNQKVRIRFGSSRLLKVAEKYQACCLHAHPQHFKTFIIGFGNDNLFLHQRCHEVAHLAIDLLEITSKMPISSTTSSKRLPVRLSAHVGMVGTGTMGITSPRFSLIGSGVDVSRALLANCGLNTVKISRSLYSQIEKCPEFEFSTREPEWITCNGTDIESYILTGRQAGSGQPVSSDTSVDSGVYVDRPGQCPPQDIIAESSLGIKAITQPNLRSGKPSFYTGFQRPQERTRMSSRGTSRATLWQPMMARSQTGLSNDGGGRRNQHLVNSNYSSAAAAFRVPHWHSATDLRHSHLTEAFSLARISEDSDTATSISELPQSGKEPVGDVEQSTARNGIVHSCHDNDTESFTQKEAKLSDPDNIFTIFNNSILHKDSSQTIGEVKPKDLTKKKLRQRNSSISFKDLTIRDITKEELHLLSDNSIFLNDDGEGQKAACAYESSTTDISKPVEIHNAKSLLEQAENQISERYRSPTQLKRTLARHDSRPESPDNYSVVSDTGLVGLVKSGSSSCSDSCKNDDGQESAKLQDLQNETYSSLSKLRETKKKSLSTKGKRLHREEFVEVGHIPDEVHTSRRHSLPIAIGKSGVKNTKSNQAKKRTGNKLTFDTEVSAHVHYTNEIEQKPRVNSTNVNIKSKRHNKIHPT